VDRKLLEKVSGQGQHDWTDAVADEKALIDAFGISGYRSFFNPQYFQPLRRVTLLAGQNNAGKSNVLRFLNDHLAESLHGFESVDRPQRMLPQSWKPSLYLAFPRPSEEELHRQLPLSRGFNYDPFSVVQKFINLPELAGPGNWLWFRFERFAETAYPTAPNQV
jgi:hypothetical protein